MRSVDFKGVATNIIGRGILWWEDLGLAVGGDWCGEEHINQYSTDSHYCQGLLLCVYHSNVRRASSVDGRGWREFCSLVRRKEEVVGEECVVDGERFLERRMGVEADDYVMSPPGRGARRQGSARVVTYFGRRF